MDLLAPLEHLEELTKEEITPEMVEEKMSIPSPDYLKKKHNLLIKKTGDARMFKYEKEYEAFCKWSALPKDERNPKTAQEWEIKYTLPKGYSNYFKTREDYRDKTLEYFWSWMMDVMPEVVYNVYKRSKSKGGTKDAALFLELLSKKMNLDKPSSVIQPLMLVGVAQEKIDKLFTPKQYENVTELIPGGDNKSG